MALRRSRLSLFTALAMLSASISAGVEGVEGAPVGDFGLTDDILFDQGDHEIRLLLEDAVNVVDIRMSRNGKRYPDGRARLADLLVELPVRDGALTGVAWGRTPQAEMALHYGTVSPARIGDHMTITIDLYLSDQPIDFFGGTATYEISLQKSGAFYEAQFKGTVAGDAVRMSSMLSLISDKHSIGYEVRDESVQGAGRGVLVPLAEKRVHEITPVAPGEHPRLIFRKADLPKIRANAKTPQGRKIISRLKEVLAVTSTQGIGYKTGTGYGDGSVAATWALLYLLEGDPDHAMRARYLAAQAMASHTASGQERGGYVSYIQGVAIAYDCCYDIWEENFKGHVARYLERQCREMADYRYDTDPIPLPSYFLNGVFEGIGPGTSIDGMMTSQGRTAALMAGLAVYNDPVLYPDAPPTLDTARLIPAPKDWQVNKLGKNHRYREVIESPEQLKGVDYDRKDSGDDGLSEGALGDFFDDLRKEDEQDKKKAIQEKIREQKQSRQVPFNTFTSGAMLRDWLFAGPFYHELGDPFRDQGGMKAIRPTYGQRVSNGRDTVEWVRLRTTEAWNRGPASAFFPRIHCDKGGGLLHHSQGVGHMRPGPRKHTLAEKFQPTNLDMPKTVLLFSALDNDKARLVQARPNLNSRETEAKMWIAGREVMDGDYFKLEKGLYPILLQIPLNRHWGWSAPHLVDFDQTALTALNDQWTSGKARLASNGNRFPRLKLHLARLMRFSKWYIDRAIGTDGWTNGNNGWDECTRKTLKALHALRNVTGIDMTRGTGAENVYKYSAITRGMLYNAEKGDGDGALRKDWGSLFHTVGIKSEEQGIARWYYDQYPAGFTYGAEGFMLLDNMLDYRPQSPAGRWPLTFRDKKMGGVIFRKDWDIRNGMHAIFEGGTYPRAMTSGVGNFIIFGYGRQWIHRVPVGGGTFQHPRLLEMNRVLIPGVFPKDPGNITYFRDDGAAGGAVTVTQNSFAKGNPGAMWWNDQITDPEDLGISMTRHMAVDYSGKSGAPGLFVVYDKVVSKYNKRPLWRMFPGKCAWTKNSDRGFALTHPKAPAGSSLSVFFVAPEKVYLDTRTVDTTLGGINFVRAWVSEPSSKEREAMSALTNLIAELQRNPSGSSTEDEKAEFELKNELVGLFGESLNKDGTIKPKEILEDAETYEFFAVMTLQQGEPPKVGYSGSGASLRVRIGERTLHWDGAKIVLGE